MKHLNPNIVVVVAAALMHHIETKVVEVKLISVSDQ